MAWSSVCSLSGASRYMTCSTGTSKPVSSMSHTIRTASGSSRSLNRSMSRSCSSLLRCQRASRSSSLWPADMMTADSGPFSRSSVSLQVTAAWRLVAGSTGTPCGPSPETCGSTSSPVACGRRPPLDRRQHGPAPARPTAQPARSNALKQRRLRVLDAARGGGPPGASGRGRGLPSTAPGRPHVTGFPPPTAGTRPRRARRRLPSSSPGLSPTGSMQS